MKRLSDLYPEYPNIFIKDIKTNSKEVTKGDLFFCIKGITKDRNDYIDEAIKNGAVAIVTNKKVNVSIPVVLVDNPNTELVNICSKFYDNPEKKLTVIGVTGTNGKTTVAEVIQDILGDDICGYVGTNGVICSKFNQKINNTTPNVDKLYKYFDRFNKNGCKYVSMEASSEAFLHNRLNKVMFKVGIITNITEDHLNVHKTIENYVACKEKIINHIQADGVLILNSDDSHYEEIRKKCKCKVLTYGKNNADFQIINYKEYLDKTDICFKYQDKNYKITSPLLGEFNVYNLCACMLALISIDISIYEIIARLNNIKTPKGRMEFLKYGQNFHIILDYAHTTDAFKKIYKFLNKVKKRRIITVTGSAGGREHEKRSIMGKIILDNSNYCIFTTDDPRWEDVNNIIDELVSKSSNTNYERVINRELAIKKAIDMAKCNDIILIAGKGDDNYMAIGDKYIDYSDRKVIDNYFNS